MALQKQGAIMRFIDVFLKRYTKWQLLEVYYFDICWYVIQVRQNKLTGYKHFKCRKISRHHYGTSSNLNVETITKMFKEVENKTTDKILDKYRDKGFVVPDAEDISNFKMEE
jgi:hypothetical protein